MATTKVMSRMPSALPPRRRPPLRWLVLAGVLALVGLLAAVARGPVRTAAQDPGDPSPNGFIDQARGTYLVVQLTPGEASYGWFSFAVPGVGLFEATGAQVTVTSPTAVRVAYDGAGLLDAGATIDSELTWGTKPSGQSSPVTLRLEAQLNPEARTGTAQLWHGGQQYDVVAEAPARTAEPVLAEIVAALVQSDGARLYSHADRRLRGAMSEAEFVAWFNSDLQSLGTLTGVRVLVAPTYTADKAGYHSAGALLELTVVNGGATSIQWLYVALVADGGAWKFNTFVPTPDDELLVAGGGPYTVAQGQSVTVAASSLNPAGGAVSYAWDLDGDGSYESAGQSTTFSAAGLAGPTERMIGVQATNSAGQTATAKAAVNVTNSAPLVSLSPTSLTFGAQALNTTSAAQTVTLSNTGAGALAISSIAAAGDFAQTNTCGASLAAGASCAISVTFTPTVADSWTGSLTITDNAAGSPRTVALSGTGTAPAVSLSPTSLTFGQQAVNATSAAQAVTLTNTGNAPLTIGGIATTGDFAQTNTCGTSVAASANCTISVTFTPTVAGGRSGALTITSNAPGSPHTVALSGTGTLRAWAWGDNINGQLGNGTTTGGTTPVQASGLTGATAVTGGRWHSLALKSDGTVWAWGSNSYGQLGDGTTADRTSPVQVSGLTGVTAVAAGWFHSLAIKSDGTVWAWGSNLGGQLGDGTIANRATPVQVGGLSGVTAVAAGERHSLALKGDGTVWAWGENGLGQLGDGTITNRLTPVQVGGLSGVSALAGGRSHSLAVKADGTAWAWGWNQYGQLGDGTTTDRRAPVRVSGLTGVTAVAAGERHGLALKGDGTVAAWGDNGAGQLGDGTTTDRATPVAVGGLSGVTAVAAGWFHSLALRSDGSVSAWGRNAEGQLGTTTTGKCAGTGCSTIPVAVGGLSGGTAIAAGANHSLALKP